MHIVQPYLVPLDAQTLVDALMEAPDRPASYSVQARTTLPAILDDDMIVIDIIEEVLGGCVVRVAPILGTIHELTQFCETRDRAATLAACEKAADRATQALIALGSLEAARKKGKWRPVSQDDRTTWSAHVTRSNIQNMRGQSLARAA